MDLKKSPAILLCIGLLIGVAVAESVYYVFSPMVLVDGSVEVITDRDYYPRVSELLSGAKESIHMAMFSMSYQSSPQYSDSNANKLINQLISARNGGLEVSVVMDDWYDHNKKTLAHLQKNNVPAKLVNMDGSMHCKLIIIDGKTVIVGSTNWSYYAIDKNREASVVIRDERIARIFEEYLFSISAS